MNENQFHHRYSWLFLAALFGLAAGLALLTFKQDLADFVAGFLVGLSSVGMGASIYRIIQQTTLRVEK